MKKRVLAMILSATLAVGMFGCGSKDQGQSTQSADGEIKITFPTYMAGWLREIQLVVLQNKLEIEDSKQ